MATMYLHCNSAVESLLKDDEWSGWSDREIARRCGVSSNFVGTMRTYTDRYGTTRTMNTGNIGRRPVPDIRSHLDAVFRPESAGADAAHTR